jgi:ech hydrogenase subunit F
MASMSLKWAFKKPVTSRYPFEPRQAIAGSRGKLSFDAVTCVYCGICVKKCPTGALVANRKHRKWAIDRLLCITCGYCVEVCPKKSLALGTDHMSPTVTRDKEFYSSPEIISPKVDRHELRVEG